MSIEEKWNDVYGYEGLYEISSNGMIKNILTGKILKLSVNKAHGYCEVGLTKNKKSKVHRVHKLMIQSFVDSSYSGFNKEKVIDHIDGNKTNNSLNNLRIITQKENVNCGKYIDKYSKSILLYDNELNFIKEFKNAKEIEKEIKIDEKTVQHYCKQPIKNIEKFIHNGPKYNYMFFYKNDMILNFLISIKEKERNKFITLLKSDLENFDGLAEECVERKDIHELLENNAVRKYIESVQALLGKEK